MQTISIIHTTNTGMSEHSPLFYSKFTLVHYFYKKHSFYIHCLRLHKSIHRNYVKETPRAKKIHCLHLPNIPSILNTCGYCIWRSAIIWSGNTYIYNCIGQLILCLDLNPLLWRTDKIVILKWLFYSISILLLLNSCKDVWCGIIWAECILHTEVGNTSLRYF